MEVPETIELAVLNPESVELPDTDDEPAVDVSAEEPVVPVSDWLPPEDKPPVDESAELLSPLELLSELSADEGSPLENAPESEDPPRLPLSDESRLDSELPDDEPDAPPLDSLPAHDESSDDADSEALDDPADDPVQSSLDASVLSSHERSDDRADEADETSSDEPSEVRVEEWADVVPSVKSLESNDCVVMETWPPAGFCCGVSQRSSCGGSGQRLRGSSGPRSSLNCGAWSNCTRSDSIAPTNSSWPSRSSRRTRPSQGSGSVTDGSVSIW